MPEVYCVRAENGRYADAFFRGGFAAIGWFQDFDLTGVRDGKGLSQLYPQYHPEDTSPNVIGQQVGQVARFLFDIKPGDFILTPTLVNIRNKRN